MTNPNGRFGIHGGQYIPETLMNAFIELEEAYNHFKNDPTFQNELKEVLLGLGYKEKELKPILAKVNTSLTIEEQVKDALKLLLR